MTEENCGGAPLPIDDWLTSWENAGKSIGAPMVFISYAYATPEHCRWVKRLSDKLRNDGVNTVIDKYLPSGYDLAQFMGKAPLWPGVKYIVCVCSSLYTQKATNGTGGVGYEKMIVNRELVEQTNTNKFIPILRDNPEGETPDFLGTRFYCDFREDADFETMYQQLLKDILGLSKAPALGKGYKAATPNATQSSTSPSRQTTHSETISTLLDFTPTELKVLILIYRANETVFFVHEYGPNATPKWKLTTSEKTIWVNYDSGKAMKTTLHRLAEKKVLQEDREGFSTMDGVHTLQTPFSPNREGRAFFRNLKNLTSDSLTATTSPLPNRFVWSPEYGIGVVEDVEDNEAQITFFPKLKEEIITIQLNDPQTQLFQLQDF